MNYAEAIGLLEGLNRFGFRPGLDTTRRLATHAGNPERGLRFIHVAGTNGKGSTCAYLEGLYRAHGLRVGLYTSPHLVSFRERMQVGGRQIREVDVVRLVQRLRSGLIGLGPDEHPTFFEFITVMALCWFREQECDLVIWETGLGGRLDATNIVHPLASIITNIGRDHMQWLGDTTVAIAAEKAGILKPGVPALTATDDPDALAVLQKRAAAVRAELYVVAKDGPEAGFARGMRLPLAGEHQVLNAALAIATARVLQASLPLDTASMVRGLQGVHWPGRFQVVSQGPRTLVLDGAHNGPAFVVLSTTLRQAYPGEPYTLVLGMLADKDPAEALTHLVPGATRVVVVAVRGTSRAGDPAVLAARCVAAAGGRPVEVAGSLAEALTVVGEAGLVVVTGSLYLVGEALQLLEGRTQSERELNDWSRKG